MNTNNAARRRRFALSMSACAPALIAALCASQATAQAPQADLDEVVVTGSRVATGFAAPTPTTVVGSEQVQLRAATNIATLLNESPAFKASSTPTTSATSSANAGSNFLNLRTLGPQRTLVLVDGRRHVATTSSGLVDLNAIPVNLLSRVEVVTGGASAAYGSDAVAGVVNLILDDKLQGGKMDAQYGITGHDDNRELRFSAAYGTGFAADRGHLIIGGEYSDNSGVLDQSRRDWGRKGYQLITNPTYTPTNGQFQRLIAADVHPVNATEGGLITTGVLANTQFLQGGVTAPFASGTSRGSAYMIGGDGIHQGKYVSLNVPVERYALFSRANYQLTDTIKLFVEGSLSRSQSTNDIIQPFNFGDITIQRDNAFLPANVRAAMTTAGENSFRMGRISTDLGFYTADFDTKTRRGVIGLEGTTAGWEWNAYYEEGKTDYHATLRNRVTARFNNAVDSVISPTTGQAVCRINADAITTNDDPACVAANLFGNGAVSAQAANYIMRQQWQQTDIGQRVAEFSVSGSPFSSWAGPVKLAFGADYRKETVDTTVDALSIANAYSIGNPKPIKGSYDVKEAFGEILLPVLADLPFAKSADINAAIRYTDYSTSGSVTTWKVGGSWAISDAIRLRATRSRDIRAPNIDELFTTGQLRFSTVIDPRNGAQSNVSTLAGGNTALTPERADTFTAGVVLQPTFLGGLRASVDYYDIKVEGAIGALGAQDIVTRCAAGATELCTRIIRDGAGAISQIVLTQLNLSRLSTRGIDAEVSYKMSLADFSSLPGTLNFRVLSTYVDKLETNDGITAIDRAGVLGNGLGGVPHWRVNGSVTYQNEGVTLYTQGRFIGAGTYDNTFAANGVNDNSIPSRFYVDLSGQYKLGGEHDLTLFANINNLLDKDPPVNPSSFYATLNTAGELYDVIGRYFVFGVRAKF